jgi:hypothetical protein
MVWSDRAVTAILDIARCCGRHPHPPAVFHSLVMRFASCRKIGVNRAYSFLVISLSILVFFWSSSLIGNYSRFYLIAICEAFQVDFNVVICLSTCIALCRSCVVPFVRIWSLPKLHPFMCMLYLTMLWVIWWISALNLCHVWQHTEREKTRYCVYTMSSWGWALCRSKHVEELIWYYCWIKKIVHQVGCKISILCFECLRLYTYLTRNNWCILKHDQQDATLYNTIYYCQRCTCF